MRKLHRPEAPECWITHSPQWNADYSQRILANPKYVFVWRKKKTCFSVAKSTLLEMTQRHCAFCDAKVKVKKGESIEHFKPKELYPLEAYSWTNLFPCCYVCNNAKGVKFSQNLLKFDDVDYAFFKYFEVEFKTGKVNPKPGLTLIEQESAENTINFYNLNDEERCSARKMELDSYEAFKLADPDKYTLNDFDFRFYIEASL